MRLGHRCLLPLTLVLGAGRLFAGGLTVDPNLPAYRAEVAVQGEIVCAGNHATDGLITAWAERFAKFQPAVRLRLRTDTRLTTAAFNEVIARGDIDLTPCAREPFPSELARFRDKYGGFPLVIAMATGSYAAKSGTHALAVYVHADNPLGRLTLSQLRGIYARGGAITRWGQLGLTGEWTDRPIHVYAPQIIPTGGKSLGIKNYFQQRVFGGETDFQAGLREVVDAGPAPEEHMLNVITRRLAGDPLGIAYSGFGNRVAGIKSLALAETDAGPFLAGTHDEVVRREYAFTRTVFLCVNQPADRPLTPAMREFLRFVLSRDGQQVLTEGKEKYLPLPAAFAATERAKVH